MTITDTTRRPATEFSGGEGLDRFRAPHPALVVTGVVILALVVSGATLIGPAAAIALAVLGAVTLIVLTRPALAVLIVTALVPVTSGVRRGYPVPGLRLSEVLLLLFSDPSS